MLRRTIFGKSDKKMIFIIVAVTLIMLMPTASAEITFDTFDDQYLPGPASFGFTVSNPTENKLSLFIYAVAYPESTPDYLDTPINEWEVNLSSGELRHFWMNMTIIDIAEDGNHILAIYVTGDESDYAEKSFNVTGTLKIIDMNIVTCTKPCNYYTKNFLLSDSPINIKVLDSAGFNLTGTVETPFGNIELLNFYSGNADLDLSQTVKYNIEVTASKSGYKTEKEIIEIEVFEEMPEVIIYVPCNINDICDGEENNLNCPQDCKYASNQLYEYLHYLLIIIPAAIIIIFIILKRRKTSEGNGWEKLERKLRRGS